MRGYEEVKNKTLITTDCKHDIEGIENLKTPSI
jgi:hypothetical protein